MITLYLLKQGSSLGVTNGTFCVSLKKRIIETLPVHNVEKIVIIGGINLTNSALSLALKNGIDITLLTKAGRLKGKVVGDFNGRPGLRYQQYKKTNDPIFCLDISKQFIKGKIEGSRNLIKSISGKRKQKLNKNFIIQTDELLNKVKRVGEISQLRGYEGTAARLYFKELEMIIPKEFGFTGRNRRPPKDPFNAMLSLGYTILTNYSWSFLSIEGLDVKAGIFHKEGRNAPSLALDLCEEFRPLVDSVVLNMIFENVVRAKDFSVDSNGAKFAQSGLRKYLNYFDNNLMKSIGQTESNLNLFENQAKSLKNIFQDNKAYEPYVFGVEN